MPEYTKLVIDSKNQFVHKVEEWVGFNDSNVPIYEYRNRANYQSRFSVTNLEPATLNEYLTYINTPKI